MTGKVSADTLKALALVKKGKTPYRAAKLTGIALSTIYRALSRQDGSAARKAGRRGRNGSSAK